MQEAKPTWPEYFVTAQSILAKLHQHKVVHNDLAKEPNWLVGPDGAPIVIDFQLAWLAKRRSALFATLAREDLRHLLKHKRTYCPAELSEDELQILATPASFNRLWMRTGKRAYLFVTRKILHWSDREGAGDRHAAKRDD